MAKVDAYLSRMGKQQKVKGIKSVLGEYAYSGDQTISGMTKLATKAIDRAGQIGGDCKVSKSKRKRDPNKPPKKWSKWIKFSVACSKDMDGTQPEKLKQCGIIYRQLSDNEKENHEYTQEGAKYEREKREKWESEHPR